jgi:hypothetical protein
VAEVNDDHARPSPLSGLWCFTIGGVGLVALTVALDPITRQEDCPNYGASGNASAFPNPVWDLYLPILALGWMVLIILEQALPLTWRNRSQIDIATRAATAVTLSLVGSCGLLPWLLIMCH